MVKSRQRKLDERFGVETSAKGTRFKLNRDMAGFHLSNRSELTVEEREGRVKINLPQPEKLRTIGDLIYFDNVQYGFSKASIPLLADVSFTVEQSGRLAVVGADGSGKTTLAKLIVGELQPTKGKSVRQQLLRIGHFSQHSVGDLSLPLTSLSFNNTPVTALSYFLDHFEAKGEKVLEQEARALLGSLGLQGDTAARTPLAQLSGGQKVSFSCLSSFFLRSLTFPSVNRSASPLPSSSSTHRLSSCWTRSPPMSTRPPLKLSPALSNLTPAPSSSSPTIDGLAASSSKMSHFERLRARRLRRRAARARRKVQGGRGRHGGSEEGR
jgi:ABC-type uncharacterized transport system YnjBCD ATPase subunit